uniref:Spectrin repeat containing, nuclear envelope 1b n=1 Tax=Oncorhynchus mykiss TaxID=8022 RepID=A0A8C7ULC6_ONCMY
MERADEQEAVQKRTFTKWINSHLTKRKPPLEVTDLFEDIKDGVKLLALLEVLSGQRLPCEQGRQLKRIHWVSNIGTALRFLEGRKIKLVNIHATDIADGRPSIVLGLIWTVILYFQIEELTSNLLALEALSSSTSSVDSMASSSETGSPALKREVAPKKFQGNAKKALLRWVQSTAAKYGIEVKDFGASWRSGVAFHSVVHAIRPDLVDMELVRRRSNRENLEEAFSLAENELGIPRLLDPEDVDVDKPDEKSIMTYVAQFLKHYPNPHHSETDGQGEEREERKVLRELKVWLEQLERDMLQVQGSEGNITDKYQGFKSFRVQYEIKMKQTEPLLQPVHKDGKLSVDQALVKQAWEHISSTLLDWHIHLDKSLPGPLGVIGALLHRAEIAQREEIPIQQAHEETANVIQRKLEQHKEILKNLESHKQTFQQIHRERSVNGVPVPPEHLQDMAERFNYVSTSSYAHLIKLEFWEIKYRLMAFLILAESKLKSWIIKYGRRDSVELLLQSYITFIEGHMFFEQYETTFKALRQSADVYVKSDGSSEEAEGVGKFLSDASAQWRNLSVEVRSVRSMLEEVISNWEKYSSTVAGLQAWLEDAEQMLNQSENDKRDFFRNLPHWIQQHLDMNDAGNFLIETCDETVSRDLKQQLLILNGRWRELFVKVKHYARVDEVDKWKQDYQDCMATLKTFMNATNDKMTAPVQVSFLNVRTFVQDVEDIKNKVPAMEAACKTASRTAQLLVKDTPAEEVSTMLAVMASIKEEMSKVTIRLHLTCSFVCWVMRIACEYVCICVSQAMINESTEWKNHVEVNSNLMKRFDESRGELEKVLKVAQAFLNERGNPEDLLKRHTEFFGKLDQQVLDAFLKTCDELTDTVPREEQQSLQETVRKLHKHWKDVQTEAPYHLLHLKVEVERSKLMVSMQECQSELTRENRHLVGMGSERLIKEHRDFFREKGPQSLCEKKLQLIEELCQKLPDSNPAHQTLDSSKKAYSELWEEIDSTHHNLMQHPDKWEEFNTRFSELSAWLSSKESQLRLLRNRANDPSKHGQVKATITVKLQEGNLGWLKSRLAVLIEICSETDAQSQAGAINKLSTNFKGLLSYLTESEKVVLAVGDCVQFREEVRGALDELVQGQQEVHLEVTRILDSETVREAQQLLQVHQVSRTGVELIVALFSSTKALDGMKNQWTRFGTEFEAFSSWISEKEKEMDALKSSAAPLGQQINTVKVLSVLSQLEAHSQALAQFISSGEAARIKARLTQIGSLESLKAALLPLSAGARRLSDREQAERAVAALQTSYDQSLGQAKEKQNTLEKVLSLWQNITFCKGGKYFFMSLTVCDFPVICILYRIKELQSQLFQVEQFDQSLLKFSQWSENLLSTLHSTSLVNITDLQAQNKNICVMPPPLQTHGAAVGVLRGLRQTVESSGSWDHGRVEELQRELETIIPDISSLETLAAGLDSSLCKGHLHMVSGVDGSGSRTSCRVLADGLSGELDTVRNLLGTKQSEAEALGVLWSSFRQRKEQLLKSVEDIKEKADHQSLREPSPLALQQRLRFFNQLEDELQSQQHEEQWLRDKGQQLAQRDAELAGEVLREISLLETTWEDTKRLITDRQEQCSVLVELMREYHNLRTSIAATMENTEADIGSALKDHEETKKSLAKHEAVKAEMLAKQSELDQFSSKGKLLLCDLKKIPDCEAQLMTTDMQTLVDQWLEVSERIENNIEHLSQSLALSDDVQQISEEIEGWTNSSMMELSESLNNLIGSQRMETRLSALQVGNMDRVNSSSVGLPHTTSAGANQYSVCLFQVLEADLRKKLSQVQKLCEQAKGNLRDFSSQRKQLEDYITQMSDWLKSIEQSLTSSPIGSDLEDICRVKELQKDLQNQQGSIDSTRESLNTLCRKYPSEELAGLGSALTDLIKGYESVNQLSSRTLASLQHGLQKHFNGEDGWFLRGVIIKRRGIWFEGRLKRLRQWLEHMEQRVTSELPEEKHRGLEKATLEGVEEYHQEVLKERDSFERLCQESQVLNEGGRGDGGETRAAAGLQSQHQALLRRVRERLRCCQVNLQEQEAFKETLQSTWSWLNGMKERLGTLNSTLGNKVTLEKRLGLVQDILLMKGEGEVKLNMAVGKGEQVLKHHSVEGQEAICSQLQNLKDAWASMLMTSMSCHSRLEWTVAQWSNYQDSKGQLQQWMESVEQEVGLALDQQPGLKEKAYLLERLRALQADVEAHAAPLARLTETAAELHEKTGDQAFGPEQRMELNAHFADITVQAMENRVTEHEHYLEAVRDFNDWLASAKEELQRWSDLSGDSTSVNRKLAKVQELIDSRQRGRERLSRVQRCGAATRDHTGSAGFEAVEREEAALLSAWEQWERGALQNRAGLETALSQLASSEQEFNCLAAQLEVDLQEFSSQLQEWRHRLSHAEGKNSREEAVQGWQIDTLEGLVKMEPMSDSLKFQLNGLCRFSKDLGTQSERVSSLIKEYNRLSLQASRECQNKEKLLEQQFRAAFREFQQWLVNAKINTAKCFDVPQNLSEASSSLEKIQEFLSDREQGHSKLNAVVLSGELVVSIAAKDRVDAVRAKMSSAREDWKTLMSNLHQRETALQNLQSQMKDFEASVEPLQEWLNGTEVAVQESSTRLHDLTAKKQELHKLQSVLEELASQEVQLIRLREKAQLLWDGHAARKSFVHRVSQLSAQYLALTNLTKEKASRIDRIVTEHQLFSQGLKELQNWVADTSHMLQTYRTPTADKNVLDSRMIKLEALLTARQEKEIQLKMLVTRGESVQRNTSVEGVPVVCKNIQDLKDSWDTLLSASIQCKRLASLFNSLDPRDKQCSEMRDKTANLGKAKTAVGKAEELVQAHQEYERGLNVFEAWLEQEQEKLGCYTQLEGDVDTLEETLQKLQELQVQCTEGQALFNTLLDSRDQVVPWGVPQIEDRVLETLQQNWNLYQGKLGDTRTQLNSTLAKLRQMEQKFQGLDSWLNSMESKGQLRSHRRSDRATKDTQLQLIKSWQEEVLVYQEEVEGLSVLAQQVIDETHISSRVSTRATQLTSRYHALLLHLLESIKQLQVEVCCIEEAQNVFRTFSDWLSSAKNNFSTLAISISVVDRLTMERKMKTLEALQGDMEQGHSFLKTMREKTERAVAFLEEPEAEQLREEVDAHRSQLEGLMAGLRTEHSSLEKLQSHESAVRSVVEKGEVLLNMVCDPTIRDNMNRLQTDYQELCTAAKSQVQSLVECVKEHECYNSELQEVEKWLLQMSSRLVTSDSMQTCSMETATQQLARHKVYQSLDRELQKHVSHQDTLQQCQTWLSTANEELLLHCQPPFGMQEALKQVKHYRALQEQASTYLDLVCSVCDLSDDAVRATAAEVQQVKHTERMLSSQELCEGWREIKEQKQELSDQFQDMEQQLLSLSRRPAELETKIALNMLTQATEFSQQLQNKQATLSRMTEIVSRLTAGQDSPEHGEIGRLSHAWLGLFHQANRLKSQRQEDLQRIQEYHNCITAMEALFEQMSKEWDNLARTDAESSSEHLEALKKLAVALGDQKGTLEDLKDQRQKVTPHLNLDDKELVKEQISHFEQRWVQLQSLINRKIQDSVLTLEDMAKVEARLREAREWAEEQQPGLSEAMKMSPPPELAQSFLFDHLSICSELEAKQLLLAQAMSDADRLLAHLGLNECQRLQQLISDTQAEVESLSVKYFKADLEKTCQWLKQADIVTFPEINLMNGDLELNVQLLKYRQIVEQAMEYENLLLIVQRTGQEILPTLNEVDHCYLDEKLNALPQKYNSILALAKEKQEKIEQAILARKEYASFIDVTHKALKELEEQFHNLGLQPVGLQTEEVVNLLSDYKALQVDLGNLGLAVSELNQKKEGFRSTGQPWRPEELTQLVSLYNGLKRLIEQRVEHLDDTLESFEDHKAMAMQVDSELKATKEELVKVNAETQSAEERLKNYHALAGSLQSASSHLSRLMEQMDNLAPQLDKAAHDASREQVVLWQEELQSLQSAVGELIVECENRFVQSKDFETEVKRTLDWLQHIRDELGCSVVVVDVRVEKVQEEIRKQQIMQDEVQSRLRIVEALSSREKQKYTSANELVPAHVDLSLEEMAKLQADVQQAMSSKQITLEQALALCQKYHFRMQSACEWLEEAVAFLQLASLGVDVENYEECLRHCSLPFSWEQKFLDHLQELEALPPQLENLVNLTAKEQLRLNVESAQQRGVEVRDQLQNHQDEKLTGLEEQASQLELVGSEASKATISRSMTTVWQRWTRLRSVARGQERVLEDTAQEWGTFREKMVKLRSMVEDLQSHIIDCVVEKASKATLQSVLDQHELLIQDVERELSSLTLLRQYALSLLHDVEVPSPSPTSGQDELPSLKEIRAVQDHLESVVKSWIQETRELLPNTTSDIDALLQELEHVDKIAEQQQSKYLDLYTILPSEISMQLAEVSLALGAIQDQIQKTRDIKEDISSRIHDVSEKMKAISTSLNDKASDVHHAKDETKAGTHLEEYNEMLDFIVRWSEKAKGLVRANIIWNSCSHLQEQIRMDESVLRESRELHGDLQAMGEKVDLLSEVLQTENMSQQVCELSRHTEELQQTIRTRLQSLQDAAKSMEPLEYEVKTLQVALEQVQATLTSPDLSRQSLKEQLAQRQRLLSEMEGFKLQVQAVQLCQSALRVPEEVMPDLAICHTALGLQQEASQLQHVVIQQCNILQEAVVQYEQYEQEAKHFQGLIEDAHRVIQDRPIPTSTIQELQAQILHHEELAQKIKGYQEEIASLNSKCQMLTVKAKHDTMLLTVSDTERVGLTVEDLDGDVDKPSVLMMTAGRCHTLLSPVTEESGEEGTSSEISSPVCRSPSPNTLPRAPVQELNDPMFESEANLDDLQRSWETMENVISEKQRSLYEALEKQQCNQGSLQSISSKMEAIEAKLNKPLEADRSTDSHMEAHQAVVEEVQRLQEEIDKLQTSFSDQLGSDAVDDTAHQLAMQSTLTVLSERMATIQMKASGKRQLLEERVSDRLEDQHQEQTLRHYLNQADQMDQWLLSTREALRPSAEEEQLIDGQNMLQEIEQKVVALSELTMRSESLLLEGRQETRMDMREDTEQLARKLRTLKGSLLELQRMLQDKHINIQDQEESESDSTLSQGPIVQDCLVQAHTTLSQHHQDSLQRQRELEEQLAEQKKLLQSVASRGEEILMKQASPSSVSMTEPCSPEILLERETRAAQYQMRQRWESLRKELSTKLQLLQKTLEQDHKQQVLTSPTAAGTLFKAEIRKTEDTSSLKMLYEGFSQTMEEMSCQGKVIPMEQHLYQAVSATSSWLDDVENTLFSGPTLLTENAETQLQNQEVDHWLCAEDQVLLEDTLDCLTERLQTLDSALERRCEHMRTRMQELTAYQVSEAEEGLREFEQRITQLKTRGTELQAEQMSINEMLKLQDAYEELVMTVGSRRSSLNQNMALKGQYERALQDLADLVDTAQDKMAGDQRVIASSVEEVQVLLDKHKEFFQSLESHMILTETFFRKISGLVVPREKQALEEILTLAQGVLKQAHRRGVALEYILETWSRLVPDYQALCMQLDAVQGSIPTVGLVEETEESLTERSSLYQSLKGRLMEHQHKLSQVLEEGKRLQLSVCCPGLDTKLTVLGEHWLSNTTKVNKELQRLEAILKHWTRYQKESSELIGWLQSALERLGFWNNQAVVVPQEMETRRDHLSTFLDFCKEVESRSSLKNSVLTEGNQLLRLKRVGSAALRSDLARIDSEWTQLLTLIPGVQEKLHQLQMEKLASRHAISELVNWISLMENVIGEDEENLKGAVGSTVIQDYLQKYKGFRVDVRCKQLTVDFVNQSVLQISDQDVESRRSDQTDFAEKLGAMNRRWQLLQGLITERVQFLETLLEAWLNYENNIQGLKTWLLTQEGRLKRKPRIEDLTSVQNALNDCQEMEEKVKEKEGEVERVEEQACALIQNKTDEACAVVMETLQAVNHTWANLDHLIGQLKISLVSVLDQWSLYKLSSEEMNGYLMEGRYSVSRFRLLTGSLEAVQLQVKSLQSLQEELEKQEGSLRKFGSVTHQLLNECHPSVSDSLNNTLKDVNARWSSLLEEISERLKSSKALLQLWQHYKELYGKSSSSVQLQEEQADRLLETACTKDITDEEVSTWIQDCSELLRAQAPVKASLQVIQELGDQLKQQVDTSTASAVQSDHLSLTQRLATVEQALSRQLTTLQTGVQDYETFSEQLGSLGRWMVEGEEALKIQDPNSSSDLSVIQDRMEELKRQILRFSSMAHDLERLNELGYRLPLDDIEIKRMQNLNRSWSAANAQTTERFSKLQSFLLQQQTFLEKCETWMEFLVQTEEKLAVEISGNYQSLMEQQRAHKLFQAEMFSRQQILHSIISDGQRMLAQGQVDDRDEFNRKLLLLSNQWQGVVRRAQQRQGIIDSLIRQWQRYRDMSEKLRKWLVEISHPAEALLAGAPVPLQQARSMLDAVQIKEKVLQRQQGSYILTVEAGKQLLLSADSRAEVSLQGELTDIQERWRHATICLEEQRRELDKLDKDWETCERGIEGSLEKLRKLKRQFSQSIPDHHEDLQAEQMRCKDLEKTFDGWTEDLAHLTVLRESLSSYISAEDLSVLQERMELLHRQWEEICHQLSLRQQQVGEKLSEWAVFKEKNRELCDWLTQMESKVSQNGDVRIEEMIEKLRKDYYEEIAVAQENKQQLYQLGERLAKASHENKASEIEHKLSMVGERWQHLLDLIGARLKKLRETLVAVQQLDKNMISLRSWLTHIETELSRPILYDTCDSQEIQRKLDLQQELQRDIEKHSTSVASALNLCEVLLHDGDVCATDTECDSIQQTTRNLDRRWRRICALSMERRLKIEETWRLWQKIIEDFMRFEEWLVTSEKTAALPNSSGVLYTVAKEELKKFEAFQCQSHESLTQLETINKQYRHLARENRTDSSCRLREMSHDGNQRWDNLQKRVASILRRLKHFVSQREKFETARDSVVVWLTEMDLQLTNIEHFSECDIRAKIKQLRAFQQEISLTTGKVEHIFHQGEMLLQKSEPLDAAVIEEELEELRRYYQEVFGRVERYYKKLIRLPLTGEEYDVSFSDKEIELDEPGDLSSIPWSERLGDCLSSPLPSLTAPLRTGAERSGMGTPASMDSIPLEWDHDYDLRKRLESASGALGLASEHEEHGEEGIDFKLIPCVGILCGGTLDSHILQLDRVLDPSQLHLQQTENVIRSRTPTGPELDASYMGYMRLLGECRSSIDTVKRVGYELKGEGDKASGLADPIDDDSQTTGVIQRWELLQAQALSKEMRLKQNLQQWQQFNSDLNAVWAWLEQAGEELEQQRRLDLSTDIQTIELRIKKLKELQKAVDKRKATVLSINLCSAEFVQSATEESQDLQARLKEMNNRWDRLATSLGEWRAALQKALMQCHDFHEMSHGLLLWLENIDRRRNEIVPIDPIQDSNTLHEHHKTLLKIRCELLDTQRKVLSLQDMSLQLLVNSEGSDCLEAKEKVHVIGNRLKLLFKEVTRDLKELEKILDMNSSQQDLSTWSSADELDSTSGSISPVSGRSTPSRRRSQRGKCSMSQQTSGPSVSSPHRSHRFPVAGSASSPSEAEGKSSSSCFLYRVLRVAVPLQLLFLLLLVGMVCLVPVCEADFDCSQSNNFARSFHPMLQYTNGPPPV